MHQGQMALYELEESIFEPALTLHRLRDQAPLLLDGP